MLLLLLRGGQRLGLWLIVLMLLIMLVVLMVLMMLGQQRRERSGVMEPVESSRRSHGLAPTAIS